MIRLGILGSMRGRVMDALVAAIADKQLAAQIAVVISNKADALILKKATDFGLPALFIAPKGLAKEAYDQYLSALLCNYQVDLIVLIGYMRILTPQFVLDWPNKIINIHPSLLPAYGGLMDLAVHKAVLQDNNQETGCTVHYVNEQVDSGPILLQKRCAILTDDTPEHLKMRVQQLEGQALVEAIQRIAQKTTYER